jgi:hypothetical protein
VSGSKEHSAAEVLLDISPQLGGVEVYFCATFSFLDSWWIIPFRVNTL